MSDYLRIGEMAEATSVPASTLRYYERKGLLTPSSRTESNYRVYGPGDLERVRFIRVAQAAGFSLEDITSLLDFRDGVRAPCEEIEGLIDHRLGDVRTRLKEFREVERHLKDLLSLCRASSGDEDCKAIDQLASESSTS